MRLTDIRDYLQLSGQANLTQLSRRFDVPESAMQGMLELWIRKGQITVVTQDSSPCGNGGCSGCSSGCDVNDGSKIWYRWQNKKVY